jgi:hypothetical protein
MRTLSFLLALLIATFALATSAYALPLPSLNAPALPHTAAAADEEDEAEAEEDEGDDGEGDEAEACAAEEGEAEEEDEEGESEADLCEEEAEEEECDFESASAAVVANPGNGHVRITVRYRTFAPSTVNLDYSLRGGKGGLHLGSARAQFHRAGVFHDALTVGGKQLAKLAAARQFLVEVKASGTPGYCEERLTAQAPHRANRRHRAGARGRSGGPAPTRGS